MLTREQPLHVLHYTFRRFKCGEDDDGYAIKVALKYFWDYMSTQADDSPLYVFDSSYETDRVRAHRSYRVPRSIATYYRDVGPPAAAAVPQHYTARRDQPPMHAPVSQRELRHCGPP